MELDLTTWERMKLVQVLGDSRVENLRMMRVAGALLDRLELSDDEKAEIGFRKVADKNGKIVYRWQEEARVWQIEIEDREQAQVLQRVFEQYPWQVSEWRQVDALAEKIGV